MCQLMWHLGFPWKVTGKAHVVAGSYKDRIDIQALVDFM